MVVENDVEPAAKLLVRQEADLGATGGDGPRAVGGGHGARVAGGGLRAPDMEMGRRAWSCETEQRRECGRGLRRVRAARLG